MGSTRPQRRSCSVRASFSSVFFSNLMSTCCYRQTPTPVGNCGRLLLTLLSCAISANSLYIDRVKRYQSMRGLAEGDYSFSEEDLVRFFRGERREMERYIIDAQRDAITRDQQNALLEFVEWAGKGADRPVSYNSLERSFFREFLF